MRPDDERHGTNAGYLAHQRADKNACAACRAARVRYEKQRMYDRHLGKPRLIDVTGTRRRIQALVALGWTYRAIGERAGVGLSAVHKAVNRYATIRREVADRYAAVFEELSMTLPPTDTRQQKRDASYARTIARKHGWPPPLAWDDIDNPDERPAGWQYVAEDRAQAVRDLADLGLGVTQAARRLKVSPASLERWCQRHGLHDVYRQLTARETAVFERTNQHTKGGAA